MLPEVAFKELQPLCNCIVKTPNKDNLSELRKKFREYPFDVLERLQFYLIFPLELQFKNPSNSIELKTHIVDCLQDVFSRTGVNDIGLLSRFFHVLFHQLYDPDETYLVSHNVSEEFKLSVVNCISEMLKQSTLEVKRMLYTKSNVPWLSKGIYICNQLQQRETSRSLRIASIDCIMHLSQVYEDCSVVDGALQKQVGDIMMFMLPGTLGSLQATIMSDEKQGHKVTMVALRAWSRFITTVMADNIDQEPVNVIKCIKESLNKGKPKINDCEETKGGNDWQSVVQEIESKNRTAEWIAVTAEKLVPPLNAVTALLQHYHWKVRLELAVAAERILLSCFRNLKSASPTFVDILITLAEDPMDEVSSRSQLALRNVSNKSEVEDEITLCEIVENRLFDAIGDLQHSLHRKDENLIKTHVCLLNGYLKILGSESVPTILASKVYLEKLLSAVMNLLELDTSGVTILEDCSLREIDEARGMKHQKQWKIFKHISDFALVEMIEHSLGLLGYFSKTLVLIDYLIEEFKNKSHKQKEIILVMNEILKGYAEQTEDKWHVLCTLLDFYLAPDIWYAPLTVTSTVTLGIAQSNVVLVSLLGEGIGYMSRLTPGCSHWKHSQYLLKVLYPILEKVGSTNLLVSSVSAVAAQTIAETSGHVGGVPDLICSNIDYLSFHITQKLNYISENSGVLDIMCVIMHYSNETVLPHIKSMIRHVLTESCAKFEYKHFMPFLQMFYIFVKNVRKWLGKELRLNIVLEANSHIKEGEVTTSLLSYHNNILRSQNFKKDIDYKTMEEIEAEFDNYKSTSKDEIKDLETSDITNNGYPTVVAKNVSPDIKVTILVLKRCFNFLPSKVREEKILVLSILNEGLIILSDIENELLPIVHLIWGPLEERFNETSDPLIINRSFSLLCTISAVAKDFIRSRTHKKILNGLCEFLQKSAHQSKLKDSGSAYRFTQAYKLQLNLLNNIGSLAVNINLLEKELDHLLNSCTPYLSSDQPKPLQEACVKSFQTIAHFDPPAVWFKIMTLFPSVKECDLQQFEVKQIQITSEIPDVEKFKNNSEQIIEYVENVCL